ncbi:MAG: methylated-DNA--[protein]-cysteine S-methyltransferase [Lentisphaeria bacterium]|nr:methylated-DNA--[protein]-cysteine S-methyltransferase [Lentisphaeria bacterium]
MAEPEKEYRFSYSSPLGVMTLTSDGTALTGLWFEGLDHLPERTAFPAGKTLSVFLGTKEWLDTYFAGKIPAFTPPLRMKGTPFRRLVWERLLPIPYGETVTYGAIAKEIAQVSGVPRMSAQAVGGAVGHNRIAIIVPCHRVVGAKGSLVGYAAGLERKRFLLELERKTLRP